jgi:L-ascorbate metabolism protein UlaG (beta-lactamase superfamily)
VVTALGVGAYFQEWGYDSERITEGDWFDSFELGGGITLHLIPARHYSGRMLTRRQTLWVGFVLETPERRLLFSGDSGYGLHFAEIGKRFDGFDLVALDSGQYDARWAYIHMTPEEAAVAAEELGAELLLPAHVGRFALAKHAWDEPFQRISAASKEKDYQLVTPMIGEPIRLSDSTAQRFSAWWE